MKQALIVGCGYLGTALAARFNSHGYHVHGLRRRPAELPQYINPITADLLDPNTLCRLPMGLDVLVFCPSSPARDAEAYRQTYHQGLINLLRAFDGAKEPPSLLVYVSSTRVYGQRDGSWVDEQSETAPRSRAAEWLLQAEQVAQQSSTMSTIVRLSGIYGPQRDRLLRQVAAGRATLSETTRWTNRIHRDDAAAFIAQLCELKRPAPLYLCSDSHPATQNDLLRHLAEQLGHAPLARTQDEGPAPESSKRCKNTRMLSTGFRLRYPSYKEGYRALLAER